MNLYHPAVSGPCNSIAVLAALLWHRSPGFPLVQPRPPCPVIFHYARTYVTPDIGGYKGSLKFEVRILAEKEAAKSKLFWLIAGGIVSLVFGVAGALTSSYLSDSSPRLTYTISAVNFFEGQQNKLGVTTVVVANPGGKEVESVECNVTLSPARIKEPRLTGLPETGFSVKHSGETITATAQFLNPKESFTLQILTEPVGNSPIKPIVEVRGKGVLGVDSPRNDANSPTKVSIFSLFFGLLTAFVANIVLARMFIKRHGTLRLSIKRLLGEDDDDDALAYATQDSVAFLLGLNGFHELADRVRAGDREASWLSYSDMIVEYVTRVQDGDQARLGRAINVLEAIMVNTSFLMPKTAAVLNINIARLYLRQGNEDEAMRRIKRSVREHRGVATKRCELIPDLVRFKQECQA